MLKFWDFITADISQANDIHSGFRFWYLSFYTSDMKGPEIFIFLKSYTMLHSMCQRKSATACIKSKRYSNLSGRILVMQGAGSPASPIAPVVGCAIL